MWNWIVQNGPGLSASAALVTALVAVWGVRRAVLDGSERSRPVVIAEFQYAADADEIIELIVRNAGPSIARDVQVTFDPPISVPGKESPARVVGVLASRYAKPLGTLAPDQVMSNIWWANDHGAGVKQNLPNLYPLPAEVSVLVSYKGSRRRPYKDEFCLSALALTHKTYAVSSTSVRGYMAAITSSTDGIAASLKALVQRPSTRTITSEPSILQRWFGRQ